MIPDQEDDIKQSLRKWELIEGHIVLEENTTTLQIIWLAEVKGTVSRKSWRDGGTG
jgi:hypothetical protein